MFFMIQIFKNNHICTPDYYSKISKSIICVIKQEIKGLLIIINKN